MKKINNYKLQFIISCLVGILLSIFSSCSSINYDITKVEPIKSVKWISDSVTLSSQVSNFMYVNGRYYLSDFYRGIISFDDSFCKYEVDNANKYISKEPQCYMFAINKKGDLILYNSMSRMFINTGKGAANDTTIVENYELTQPSRFVLSGDSIICSIIKNKMTASIFNHGVLRDTCFPTMTGLDDVRMPYHSGRILVKDETHYYNIAKGLPIIQMFSSKFQFVNSYDLNNIEDIAETFEQEKSNKPNSYYVVIKDAYAVNGMLYLLVSSKKNGNYRSNRVLKFVTKDNFLEYAGFYELRGKRYSTICVNGRGHVVVINSKTSCCEVYEF